MSEKVGLVSVSNYNYGSILQAYAFQQVLFNKGIDNEIILYKKQNSIKQMLRVFNLPLLKAKAKVIERGIRSRFDQRVKHEMQKRNDAFSIFVRTNMFFSDEYVGRSALEEGAKGYKAFILGSDQVWNPMNLGSDYYTMTFCPKNSLKVAYAPSFGVSQIPKYQMKRTKDYLSQINEISVRETDGARIVKALTGRQVPVVADPTLLLDSEGWLRIIPDKRICDSKYIFAYYVGSNIEHRNYLKELAKATGFSIVGIPYVDEYVQADDFMVNDTFPGVGPAEFVNLIRNAEFVCTDSFHATMFSIQYKKKFFVFDRYGTDDKASMNGRLYSILKRLGLEDRLVAKRGNPTDWFDEEIDYEVSRDRLIEFRCESQTYLDKICNMVKSAM